ncbi:glycerophosphodiester phosphodiesterase family protein [Tersicoccus sp. Bi-70]|uniref:glycerophosphodiester phosphodiesterase n=1 Tax=Tersicoccus sp. Bi-70 TaxID=1897634 RepID=UPI001E2D5A5F|nr:glycerophosphodiester phosphodiesterase family protein [Tersicoccus sp. Bi-70]
MSDALSKSPPGSSAQTPAVYAHRGASARWAEHTRAAYLQALEDGADGVECDIHLTRDGHPVLWHDDTLDRTSDGTGDVANLTLAAMRRLDVSSWKGAAIPTRFGARSQQLLTLDDLLDLLLAHGRPVGLAIELKHPSPAGRRLEETVLTVLMRRGLDPETCRLGTISVSFMSFSAEAVNYLIATVDSDHVCQLIDEVSIHDLRTKELLGPVMRTIVTRYLRRIFSEANVVINNQRVGMVGPGVAYVRRHPRRIERWIAAGALLRVWTVDDVEDARFCLDRGVQQLTSNRPGELRAWLQTERVLPTERAGRPAPATTPGV